MNWATSERPLVIAHRGFTRSDPENSLKAVEAAQALGTDGVEVDLRLTRDGELVLCHDPGPEKLARRDLPRALAALPELLDLVGGRMLINLELKNTRLFGDRMEKKLLEDLKGYDTETILVSSFHPPTLCRLKQLAPHLLRGQLFTDRQRLFAPLVTPWIRPFSLNIPFRSLTRERIARSHKRGFKVFVWTVNGAGDMEECLDLQADGIITDEPDRLIRLFGTHRTSGDLGG